MAVKMQAKLGMADQSNFTRNYEKELSRLMGNDKNVINALTELANVNKPRANEIVGVIESTIRKIPKERHLSHIYLMDSICKNHGEPYITYFGQNIIQTFCFIFKYADEEIRKSLYKLRMTWNDAEMFLDKLHDLDTKVKSTIDPAWPILKVKPRSSTNNKIIINPKKLPGGMNSLPQGTRKSADRDRQKEAEEETERIRMDLLRKEKELLELKRKQLDKELHEQRNKERNKRAESAGVTNSSSSGGKSTSSSTSSHSDSSSSNHKSERKSEPPQPTSSTESPKESTEIRDPRRRKKHSPDDKEQSKSSSGHHSSSSSSSSRKKSTSDKSSPKKSSKSDKDKDKKSSSSKSGSSKSSSRDKDRDKSSGSSSKRSSGSHKDEDKKDGATAKKRERESSPKFSRTPSPVPQNSSQESSQDKKKSPVAVDGDGGRISPLPQPPAKKIPKIPKKVDQDRRGEKRAQEADSWGDKENVGGDNKQEGVEFTPPPDKRPRPLMIDVSHRDGEGDGKHLSPVVAGWAKHKESNPDQFRTPIKENENFFGDQQYPMQQDEGFNNRGPHFNNHPHHRYNRDRWGGSRGGSYRRGERGGGRGNGPPMPPGALRGGFHPGPWADNVRFGAPRGGRGGGFDHRGGGGRGGMGGPGGGNMRFDQEFSLPGLPGLDFTQADPEYIRNEVVPKLTNLAHECLKQGSINQVQFNEFVSKLEAMKGEQDGPGPRRPPGPDGPRDNLAPNADRPSGFGPQQKQHKNDLPFADQGELEKIKMDPTVSLEIDEVPRDIRWYGYTATITQDDNKLYEISFRKEMDTRCILIDDHIKVFCGVGAPNWTDFRLDNKVYKLRIGGPTREIFIDNTHHWHNLQFNSMKKIMLGGRMHTIYLPGDPPNVDIGQERSDLCLGKVEVSIYNSQNGPEKKSKLFLDERAQLLIIDRKPHVCKFVENYSTLLINGHPFKTNFGGFPMVISVNGNKHFVKLHLPPEGVYISNITRPASVRPPPCNKEGFAVPPAPAGPKLNLNSDTQDAGTTHDNETPPRMASTPLPPQHSIEDSTSTPKSAKVDEPSPVDQAASEPSPPAAAETAAPAPDINDLWAKLQDSGVLSMFANTTSGNTNGAAAGFIPGLDPVLASAIQPQPAASSNLPIMSVPPPGFPTHQQQHESEQQKNRASRLRRHSVGIKDVVLKSHDPSLKERQQGIVDSLYGPNDLQCKSCGHRFTREEMNNYSSHLDWHFRAKRRERDNARKAQSRRWYYEKADWIVSDEIEDDELDLSEEEVILEQSLEVPTVKVVAKDSGSNEHETCPVCMEQFNQVFRQGEEEEEGAWHLHNAMRDPNGVPYHPECFKDKELQDSKWEDDSMDTSATDIKVEAEGIVPPSTDTVNIDDDTEMTEVKQEESSDGGDTKPAAAIENDIAKVKIESLENGAETVVKTESCDNSETVQVKTEPPSGAKIKEEKADGDDSTAGETTGDTEDAKEGETEDGNKTVNLDSSDQQPAPVQMPKPKIDIKVSITTSMKQEVTRQESQASSTTDEETEFDKDSIVTKCPSQEVIDKAKPKLRGKALNVVPMACKDQGISGLCSIM